MVQFQSPRFRDDPLLVQILDDPDTGRLKLGPGSPAASVRLLQEALFDLAWNLRTDDPLRERAEFVVGSYGPRTTQAVTAFKRHFGIHFPPSEPTGLVDGFAGPRTLARLDRCCVLYDEAAQRIADKANQLIAAGTDVTFLAGQVRPTFPVEGTSGTFSPAFVAGASGALYYKAHGGEANEVHGRIHDHYAPTGPRGPLGFPITDEEPVDDLPGSRTSHFEGGRLRLDVATGVVDELLSGPPLEPETDPVF